MYRREKWRQEQPRQNKAQQERCPYRQIWAPFDTVTNNTLNSIEAGADIIMLDNMNDEQLKDSIDYIAGRAEIEVSGNFTKENIARLTGLGVNYVSSKALTHSAPIMELSVKNLRAVK